MAAGGRGGGGKSKGKRPPQSTPQKETKEREMTDNTPRRKYAPSGPKSTTADSPVNPEQTSSGKQMDEDFFNPVFVILIFVGITYTGCIVLGFLTIEQFCSYRQCHEKISTNELHLDIKENPQTKADADVVLLAQANDIKRLEEEADKKIALLSEEIKQLTRNNTHLLAREKILKGNMSTADETGTAIEQSGSHAAKELQETQSSLSKCQEEVEGSETLLKQCQGKLTDAANNMHELEALLKTCHQRNADYESSLAPVTNLRSKNEEQAIKVQSLKESVVSSTGHVQSCQAKVQNANNSLATCQKELLTEDAVKVKLQELHKINHALTTRNGEMKKEVFRCEQDRSIYHIRMKEAEEELQKIRDRPLEEETLD